MDCSIVPLKKNGLSMISTTDFFYPSVDDPYVQGRIGACNVLSDMYALGVVDIDNVLMILASSRDMEPDQRDIVTRQLILGFNDQCKEAGVECTGGQTVFNPWPIIGGSAMSCCSAQEFILPVNAIEGDVLVLTKALGTQVAVNLNEWMQLSDQTRFQKCAEVITVPQVRETFGKAVASMVRLNRNGARLMHKYGAHAATDVTGFGIIGHATNLAQNQKASVDFEIHTLPLLPYTREVEVLFPFFNLMKGLSPETSGGLLLALPADKAALFCTEIEELDGCPAWIVGKAVKAKSDRNKAYTTENLTVIIV